MRDCYIKTGEEKAKFIGVFQRSNVIDASPFVGGHPGGVIAYPVAVVEKENGQLVEYPVNNVSFKEVRNETEI
ncbi:hypothetical protein QNH23_06320 [Siminovitchia fortis]|uniref:Uncharacterized protein n=1 Tax=Siminovitchia fortis TaxID=254758 RepID=A0A443IMU6_9BACI|nr:hypothetical protein [Siminovitchia fortis]RWR06721.1 hypothetical protein D4N35_013730 [Siminovitchia fortis]WHY82986.1 hypothetical protein QNH23_06320 [Siminovitchia fortis]